RIHTDVIHRSHDLVGVGSAVISLFPHKREGAERRLALLLSLAPRRRCLRAFALHTASRRSTVASSTPGSSRRVRTGDFHLRDPGGFRRPSSGPPRPSCEGSPSF